MSNFEKLRDLIARKLVEDNLDKKALAHSIGVSKSILDKVLSKQLNSSNKIIETRPAQINIKSLLGIANHYDCSVDDLLGREEFVNKDINHYKKIDSLEAMKSLRGFINTKLNENNITIFELSKACGFGKDTFSKFMKDKDAKAVMSTPAVEAIAGYFKVSLDEIIGRNDFDDKRINGGDSAIITSDNTDFLKKFNKKDLESIEAIKEANIISSTTSIKANIPNIKSQKSRSK